MCIFIILIVKQIKTVFDVVVVVFIWNFCLLMLYFFWFKLVLDRSIKSLSLVFILFFLLISSFISDFSSKATISHLVFCWIDIVGAKVIIEVVSFLKSKRLFLYSATFCLKYFGPYLNVKFSLVSMDVFLRIFE